MPAEHITVTDTPDKILVSVRFSYIRHVLPPRCRNPRPQTFHDGEITCEIPKVKASDAPVAIIEQKSSLNGDGKWITKTYRWFGEKLYRCSFRGYACGEPRSKLGKIGEDGRCTWWSYCRFGDHQRLVDTFESQADSITAFYSSFICINGQLWREVTEPMYCVMTFGLGCNHGGTGLMVHYGYNSNLPYQNYYRLDQRKEAMKAKDAVARRRGDTNDIGRPCSTRFRILIPDAIRRNPPVDYGGEGDGFTNRCEEIISGVQNPTVAAIGVMATLFR